MSAITGDWEATVSWTTTVGEGSVVGVAVGEGSVVGVAVGEGSTVGIAVGEGSTIGGMGVCVAVGGGALLTGVTVGSASLQPATRVRTIIAVAMMQTYCSRTIRRWTRRPK